MHNRTRRRNVFGILSTILLLCSGMLLCYYGGGLLYAGGTDQRSVSLVHETVEIDTSALPDEPTLEDWYPLAIQILESQNWQLTPNLIGVGSSNIPCDSRPKLNKVTLTFAARYFKGIFPCVKYAYISPDRTSNTALVSIYYQMMEWQYAPFNPSQLPIGLNEAFKIADDYQGRTFRNSVNNECQMGFSVRANEIWEISYRAEGQRWEDWEIWVDAVNGKVERHQLPALTKPVFDTESGTGQHKTQP